MQRVYIGRDSKNQLAQAISDCGCQNPLLVTGKESYTVCGAKAALEPVLSGMHFAMFDDFSPNPKFEEALRGSVFYEKQQCDSIIAIGGGSTIDIAKAINAFQSHPHQERAITLGKKKLAKPLAPLIAIPTTAGTGSESTNFSVIYVNGKKYSLASPELMPGVAILDASYTDTLPAAITASTGFDALSQSIESYWAKAATAESQSYAAKAIPILLDNITQVTNSPTSTSRDNMLLAANYAGKAINISKTTAPHALSYGITSAFGVPHGHAVALTLGRFFNINEALAIKMERTDLLSTLGELYGFLQADSAQKAEEQWYALMLTCGLKISPQELGIRKQSDIELIVNGVNVERLSNHPIALGKNDLKQALGRKGKSTTC